jgi:glycosyltransferase involved in cell wall biosynthesis
MLRPWASLETFAHFADGQGFRHACIHSVRFFARNLASALDAASTEAPSAAPQLSAFRANQQAQESFCRSWAASPVGNTRGAARALLAQYEGCRGIVVYPVSYPIEMKQRPEHLLKCLTSRGYLCLMLELTATASPRTSELAPNLVRTNLFAPLVAELSDRPCTLLMSCVHFDYLRRLLPRARVIYDVLDDPGLSGAAEPDAATAHTALLHEADAVLFSSQPLFERFQSEVRRPLYVPNGVWPEDFAVPTAAARQHEGWVAGYCGAISELLDLDSFEAIASRPGARLELVGPIKAFDAANDPELARRMEALLKRPNCRHCGTVRYEQLPAIMAGFDVGLVPFVRNGMTDAVLPLKLFEYMAAGKPIVSTPLAAVAGLASSIDIAESGEPFAEAAERAARRGTHADYTPHLESHRWDRIAEPLANLIEESDHAAVSAPREPRPVAILNVNFFDWDGEVLYKGGAERYVADLANLLQRKGHRVRLLQNANRPFCRSFRGFDVVGVATGAGSDFARLSEAFDRELAPEEAAIASPLELACRLSPARRAIGINHGIHWDWRSNALASSLADQHTRLFEALRGCDCGVCVDTNFINWVRTYDWGLSTQLRYVPNYVDLEQFKGTGDWQPSGQTVVLYPRRICEERGFGLLVEAFSRLLPERPQVRLEICGQPLKDNAPLVEAFVRRHPGQIRWYELPMEQMSEAYRGSQITLVPTLFSEGTSLSCIEAMAAGNAVIATNVGGLPDLVIDGLNGLLIEPNADALYRAVRRLVDAPELCSRLARTGVEVAQRFSKQAWEERWSEVADLHLR